MILISKKTLIISITLIALAGFGAWFVYQYKQELENRVRSLPKSEQELNLTLTPATSTLKTYRNEEWGFEFQYPKDWRLEENSFYSPFSKFNLQGDSSAENYNPFRPHFLLNIVTTEFADRAVINFKNLNASTSIVIIGGTNGIKYEYEFEGTTQIGIDLSFGKYRMVLGTEKQYGDIFNQILATFKFLK